MMLAIKADSLILTCKIIWYTERKKNILKGSYEVTMEFSTEEDKNKSRIKSRPIISLLIGLSFFTFILIIAFIEIGKSTKPSTNGPLKNQPNNENELDKSLLSNEVDKNIIGIILDINKSEMRIRLYDIENNEEIKLTYTGGTNILDKYGQAVSIGQVGIGQIIDGGYRSQTSKLIYLQPSNKAWEYVGVNNMTIDSDQNIIKIARTKYTYEEPIIVDGDAFITLEDLARQDELTVRGLDETIWSIVVTKGHGTVKLKDYEAFIGGSITVGYESVQQVSKDMEITVREGNYNLTIENGEYSGTKNVTVERNKETIISLGDLGPDPTMYGDTTFEITPFGADLFIDGELTPYASPIKLAHGSHNIEVSLGGYLTYRGDLLVDYASKKMQVVLPEAQSRETVSVIESEEQDSEDTANVEYNDWDREPNSREEDSEYYDSEIDNEDIDEENIDGNSIIDLEHLIFIQNPSGASVYLNGEYKGVSPGSFQKVIGSHVLTFIKKGYQTKSYTIDVADDGLDTYISLPELIVE